MSGNFPERDIADFLPEARRKDFVDCKVRAHENVLPHLSFLVPAVPGPRRGYNITVHASSFKGKLEFYFGPGGGDIDIHSTGHMNVSFRLWRRVKIVICERVTISSARIIADDAEIFVGKDGLWSDEIILQSNDQHSILDAKTLELINGAQRRIEIGDHVWIGRRALLMPGIIIGSEAIIAAGTTVTKNVEPNCIYAGAPARKIREGITWGRSPAGLSDFERQLLGYSAL